MATETIYQERWIPEEPERRASGTRVQPQSGTTDLAESAPTFVSPADREAILRGLYRDLHALQAKMRSGPLNELEEAFLRDIRFEIDRWEEPERREEEAAANQVWQHLDQLAERVLVTQSMIDRLRNGS